MTGPGNPTGAQPEGAEFDRRYDRVCAYCRPMHVMEGPHKGETLPTEYAGASRDPHSRLWQVPGTYKGVPCTTGMCPKGEANVARGLRLYYARRKRESGESGESGEKGGG